MRDQEDQEGEEGFLFPSSPPITCLKAPKVPGFHSCHCFPTPPPVPPPPLTMSIPESVPFFSISRLGYPPFPPFPFPPCLFTACFLLFTVSFFLFWGGRGGKEWSSYYEEEIL